MRLALYKGKGRIGNAAIRWWTRSPYSHCELVIDGVAYSSSIMDSGVRAKRIEFDPEHWDFVDLPWASAALVKSTFASTQGDPYGWGDLFWRQVFNRPGDTHGQFCSEWCARALGLPNPQQYSPATLGDYCTYRTRTCRTASTNGAG